MKRKAFLGVVLTACLGQLAVGPVDAAQWLEIGEGSGSPPGIFQLSRYDGSIPAANRREDNPRVIATQLAQPLLVLNSATTNQVFNSNQTFALYYAGGSWGLYPQGSDGLVLDDYNQIPGGRPSAVGNAFRTMISSPAVPELGLVYDAYVSFLDDAVGWTGLGGSLEPGGISDSTVLSRMVYETAPGIDPFGSAYVAYGVGSKSRRDIEVLRYLGTSWLKVPSSRIDPVVVSPSANITNVHLAMTFSGAGPVVAWCERNINTETIKLLRFSSTTQSWEELGSSQSVGVGEGRHPQIANLAGRNSFVIAFENRLSRQLTVLQWNGSTYQDLGNPLTPWGLSSIALFNDLNLSNPEPTLPAVALALDTQGRPVVAFRGESPAGSGRYQLFVSYRNSSNVWVALGNPDSETGASAVDYTTAGLPTPIYGHHAPSLHVGIDNRPILAWLFDNGITEYPVILARRYSESINPNAVLDPEVAINQIVARLLGITEPTPILDPLLDDNEDSIIDSADLERFVSRL